MLAAFFLFTCLASSASRAAPIKNSEFTPETFFNGATRGQGTLVRRGKPPERFTVQSRGRMESADVFRLDQTVTFENGAIESRTWHIRRLDAHRYSAKLSDAAGDVSAEIRGNLFHLRYLLRRPAIYMEQRLYLQPDGRTVLNIGRVKLFGLLLAQVSETIVCSH